MEVQKQHFSGLQNFQKDLKHPTSWQEHEAPLKGFNLQILKKRTCNKAQVVQ